MISTENLTKEERAEYWQMVLDEFQDSGLTKTAYCQENEISVSTFNYWENRLRELQENSAEPRFTELPVPDGEPNEIRFTIPATPEFIPQLSLLLNDVQVFANSNTPMTLLSEVLGEPGYAKCCYRFQACLRRHRQDRSSKSPR
ncbi:MAG: hypothetical protein E7280_06730 [Lachnospiraceae bacterium]|nr:hypothetical protein [Lachnospiraceae bacterium]